MERNGGKERVGKRIKTGWREQRREQVKERNQGGGDWRREQDDEDWGGGGMQGGESKQDGERKRVEGTRWMTAHIKKESHPVILIQSK